MSNFAHEWGSYICFGMMFLVVAYCASHPMKSTGAGVPMDDEYNDGLD